VAELRRRLAGNVSPRLIADCAGPVPLLVSVKTSVVVALSLMDPAPKVLATVGGVEVTTRHWFVDALVAPAVVTFAARFVKAAGLPAQLAFTCVAALVSPETVTVQLAVPLAIAMPVRPESTWVPAVYVAGVGPEQPAEYATAGVALLIARPGGSVSPSTMPDCAGLVPVLVSVKTSVVAPPSATVPAPKVLAALGLMRFTTTHWSVEVLFAPVVVTFAARLVKAAAGQLAFTCPAWLVTPETVTVQLAVPLVIAMPVRPESTRVPAVYVAGVGPEQPAEYATAGVAELIARPAGSVSPSTMPDCAGLEPWFASVKTRLVVAPSLNDAAPKVFATFGFRWLTTRHWSLPAGVALVAVTLAARFVKAAAGQLAFTCPATFVTPETVTVQLAVPADIAMPVRPESTWVPAVYVALVGPEQPAE
jgi:hypothetical protein